MPSFELTESDLEAAYLRVLENQGCAGVDGVTLHQFSAEAALGLAILRREHSAGDYRPLPLLRIVVEKKPGSKATRTLLVPCVRDRILQTAYATALSRAFEEEFLEVSYAYRPGRGVDRAIARIRQLRDEGYWHIVDADIRGYFDHVDWGVLKGMLLERESAAVAGQLIDWMAAPYWDGARVRRRQRGVPQGSPVSPLLANLYLQPLDRALATRDSKLVRYADDFVVLTRTEAQAQAALDLTAEVLGGLKLELHPEKTSLTHFGEGLRFLGAYFTKDEIWQPWKDGPKPQGRVVAMAKPMPWAWLERYRAPLVAVLAQGVKGPAHSGRGLTGGIQSGAKSAETKVSGEGEDMAYLYLTEQGSVLRKSGDRLLVELDQQIVLDVPYTKLEHVLLFGHIQVTTQATHELLEKGIDLSYFTRGGQFRGSLTPPRSANVQDRLAQLKFWQNEPASFAMAKAVVEAKAANGLAVLKTFQPNEPWPESSQAQVAWIAGQALKIAETEHRESLMGYEGTIAKAYFGLLADCNKSGLPWPGRVKFPSTDPLNALLSFCYTLLVQELSSLVESEGLDPCLGFLHAIDRGRPSLALDLVEVFRHPVADRFVWTLANRGEVLASDFGSPEGAKGLRLSPGALKRVLAAWERWMLARKPGGQTIREALRFEVRKLLAGLRRQEGFVPFRYPEDLEQGCATSSVTT